ncbi:MAG: hypothetical protein ACRD5R_10365 [Candidatus Acidiferrales bacterium]
MKSLRLFFISIVLCVSFAGFGHAQTALIVQQKVSISQALAGHVNVGTAQEPVKGVTVELCRPDWKTMIASAKTDDHGYFSLERPATGKLFYIRLSAPGINPYRLRVRIQKHGPPELTIHLSIAT